MRRHVFLALAACAGVAALVVPAGVAEAATVTPTTGGIVSHTLPSGQSYTRDPSLNPSGINYEDCEKDVSFNFPITVNGTFGVDHLYVYAGQNCGDATQRTGAAGSTCWRVLADEVDYSTNASPTVSLRVRQILSQQYSGVSGLYVDVNAAYPGTDNNGEGICHQQSVSTVQKLDVDFVLTDSTSTVTEATATATINADLAAAIEPPNFVLNIGDDQLFPSWSAIADSDITGFNVYYILQASAQQVQVTPGCADSGSSGGEGGNVAEAGGAEASVADAASGADADDLEDVDGDTDASTTSEAGAGSDAGTGSEAGAGGGAGTTCITTSQIDAVPQAGDAAPFVPTGFKCVDPFPPNDEQPVGAGDNTTSSTTTAVDGGDASTTSVTSTGGSIGPLAFQSQEFDPSTFSVVNVSGNVSKATINGLVDKTGYAVAVAAVDAFGNVGALTSSDGTALCQIPLATTDFWSGYKNDGGENDGCSLTDTGFPGGGIATLFTVAACVVTLRRRKKSA